MAFQLEDAGISGAPTHIPHNSTCVQTIVEFFHDRIQIGFIFFSWDWNSLKRVILQLTCHLLTLWPNLESQDTLSQTRNLMP